MYQMFWFFLCLILPNFGWTNELRLVSLSPALTEILYELELGGKIVGVTKHTSYPSAAQNLPKVGDYQRPKIEKIVALQPSIVLVAKEGTDNISADLKAANLTFAALNTRSLEDFEPLVRLLAQRFQRADAAKKVLIKWQKAWRKVEHVNLKNQKVLIQLDHEPIIVAADGTFLSEALKRCGLINAFKDLKGYPRINRESLFTRPIDHVIYLEYGAGKNKIQRVRDHWKKSQKSLARITFTSADSESLGRLSLRLPKAIYQLCRQIENKKETPE